MISSKAKETLPQEVFNLEKGNDGLYNQDVDRMSKLLESQGWCFVKLPGDTLKLVDKFLKAFDKFLLKDEKEKQKFHVPPVMGYEAIGFKEVYRHWTGTELVKDNIPFEGSYVELSRHLDHLCTEFVTTHTKQLFDSSLADLNKRINVPILDPTCDADKYGVLDAVRYFKDKASDSVENNNKNKSFCLSHTDPGLFALSLHSDASGLQFLDPIADRWVDQPKERNVAVLWCGEEIVSASKGRYIPAVHRVLSLANTRTSIWYEMCTKGQGSMKLLGKRNPDNFWTFPNAYEPGSKRRKCLSLPRKSEDEFMWQACKRLETQHGIPAMKLFIPPETYHQDKVTYNKTKQSYLKQKLNKKSPLRYYRERQQRKHETNYNDKNPFHDKNPKPANGNGNDVSDEPESEKTWDKLDEELQSKKQSNCFGKIFCR